MANQRSATRSRYPAADATGDTGHADQASPVSDSDDSFLHQPLPESANQAFQHLLAEALDLEAARVLILRDAPHRLYHNITIGPDVIAPHRETLAAQHPHHHFTFLDELQPLGLGLLRADITMTADASDGSLVEKQKRGSVLRGLMLHSAGTLVLSGQLPGDRVAAIRAGTGPVDSAQDLVALASLYCDFPAAFQGRSPITSADADEADRLGTELLTRIVPKNARRAPRTPNASADLRNRFYTLVAARYKELRRWAMFLWVEETDQHVPPLHSRERGAEEPAPEAKSGDPPAPTGTPTDRGASDKAAGGAPVAELIDGKPTEQASEAA